MSEIFIRFPQFIQDYRYRSGWQELRDVQLAAADVIFNTEDNLLLTTSTASGKTEAAFFPILTLLSEDPAAGFGVLYIAEFPHSTGTATLPHLTKPRLCVIQRAYSR